MDDIGREAASTLLARQQRNGRLYDVPQIGEFKIGLKLYLILNPCKRNR